MMALVLAGLEWNKMTRGILFPALMFIILGGSSYMILATNVGNRLGFLLANAAFWGWMALMAGVWMIYGIGLKGNPPAWRVSEVVTVIDNAQANRVATLDDTKLDLTKTAAAITDKSQKIALAKSALSDMRALRNDATVPKDKKPTAGQITDASKALASLRADKTKLDKTLPKGWHSIEEGTPTRGEAQSATDAYLVPAEGTKVFPSTTDYLHVGGFDIGGEQRIKILPRKISGKSWYNPGSYRFMGLLHGKRYYVDRVASYKLDPFGAPVLDPATKKPVIDTTKPVLNVVMYRDLGNKRLPAFKVFLASLILMLVSVRSLHKRDKVVMATMKNPRGLATA